MQRNMEKNNKILEAIQRGIRLALDDFEDSEMTSSKSDIVNDGDTMKNLIDIKTNFVDLGLPSGTLWCKFNLGVSLKSKNKRKNLCGAFYAWGETKPRKDFSFKKYKYGDDVIEGGMSKYNASDKLTRLQPIDDVVTLYFQNKQYHIPTKEQLEELIEYSEIYCINKDRPFYYENGIPYFNPEGYYDRGWLLVSKINHNYIYFPLTCVYEPEYIQWPSTAIWSSDAYLNKKMGNVSDERNAYSLAFNEGGPNTFTIQYITGSRRHYGLQIRPVYNK